MTSNGFKQALLERRAQVGLWMGLANSYTTEICAAAGFDWLLIDGEHAPNDLKSLLAQLQAVAPYPVHPVGRPPVGEAWMIKQYLDIGFPTLLIPMVEDAEQARAAVRATRYPPEGLRGVGAAFARAARWGQNESYLADANRDVCLLVQVESEKALSQIEEIAAVDGVDGVFIGPADLSASLGYRGQPGHPNMQITIDTALQRIVRTGKAAGTLTANTDAAKKYLDLGCGFVGVGTDVGLLLRGAQDLAGIFGRRPAQGGGRGDGVY